ncbi:hypothetical protein GV827_12015 [Sulfitobacter sp. JBTF-M27]|uniref:Uncharacterized protein n=1 Tax=Sulfitobacter sediminilitoris TaxID=2698830 RepID=A0A6P0CB67_9RHOB|nr:hypothetical protein [Sulfitobacter sediminilitoris]NEK23127.1 hypothetical protein [Sulfitobacter sediminilitoris]
MLNIYAQSFMTATRTTGVELHEVPSKNKGARRRWFSRPKTVLVDLRKL